MVVMEKTQEIKKGCSARFAKRVKVREGKREGEGRERGEERRNTLQKIKFVRKIHNGTFHSFPRHRNGLDLTCTFGRQHK